MQTPRTRSARVQIIARVVFYVLTLGAAVLSIASTVWGGSFAPVLMSISWYFIFAGVIAFLLMLTFNLLLREDVERPARHHDMKESRCE